MVIKEIAVVFPAPEKNPSIDGTGVTGSSSEHVTHHGITHQGMWSCCCSFSSEWILPLSENTTHPPAKFLCGDTDARVFRAFPGCLSGVCLSICPFRGWNRRMLGWIFYGSIIYSSACGACGWWGEEKKLSYVTETAERRRAMKTSSRFPVSSILCHPETLGMAEIPSSLWMGVSFLSSSSSSSDAQITGPPVSE